MFDTDTGQLAELVANAAFQIQQDLIRETGSNYMEATKSERIKFEPLPVSGPKIPGLHRAPALLYGNAATIPDILNAWDSLAKAVVYRGDAELAELEARHVFPRLPINGSTTDIAVRFLQAVMWCGFDFDISKDKLTVKVGDTVCGFDGGHIHGTVLRRVPQVKIPDIFEILNRPAGRGYLASSKTTAIYRSLIRLLPKQASDIHDLARIAVHGGKACELRFIEPFDVVVIKTDVKHKDLWGEARKLVNAATINPTPALFKLLKHRVEYGQFVKLFGNPYRHGVKVTVASRGKLLDAISHLELKGSPDAQDVNGLDMLSHQQMIASINV